MKLLDFVGGVVFAAIVVITMVLYLASTPDQLSGEADLLIEEQE
ncbi:MAG: hypothetical protein ACI4QT_01970 [Kiritimatiellia bacterium]